MKNGRCEELGRCAYYKNGVYHNEGGEPAIVYIDAHMEWWVDGKRHRVDGPAYISRDGSREWWQHGSLHRIDGPAIEYGKEAYWYYRGEHVEVSSQEEFEQYLRLKSFW